MEKVIKIFFISFLTFEKCSFIRDLRHLSSFTVKFQIEYKLSKEAVKNKTLQVTIWDHDRLKENNFLGAVYIRLRDYDFGNGTPKWYTLGKLQITDPSTL